jgi:GH35 family endo-1,4-beta-xylanase
MESTVTSNYPVPMPDETLQATFRINIKVEKHSKTGERTAYITELDMSNYDKIIKDVPDFLKDHNITYALNLIQECLKAHAQ